MITEDVVKIVIENKESRRLVIEHLIMGVSNPIVDEEASLIITLFD